MSTAFAVVLSVIFFSTAQSITQEQRLAFVEECAAQSGISEDTRMKSLNGDLADGSESKAYVYCFWKKMGYLNDAGEIMKDRLREMLSLRIHNKAKVDELMETCPIKRSTAEETAFEGGKCFLKMSGF